ncbi:MAG: methionine synthase [Acidimicrobiaceae bacterium]|nr:methionine synthase [Acidimicrobiaceae bacterium]
MADYIERIKEKVLIYDGATGTNIQLLGLGPDDFGGPELEGCNEALVLSRPGVISDLHDSFLKVGVDAIETNTFGAFPLVLAEYGIADKTYEINLKAARLAKEVASSYSSKSNPKFVAGSVGPGTKFPSLGQITFAQLRDSYQIQAESLLEGGVDLILIETVFDLLSAKAAIIAARQAMEKIGRQVPIQTQVTIELTGRMLPGTEIAAALSALDAMRVDVIGINCATGPAEMSEHLRHLTSHSRTPVSCLPNAGLPSVVDGKMHYDLTPEELVAFHSRFVTDLGVRVIGGCCGTTPEHLRQVVNACSNLEPAKPEIDYEPSISSLYSAATLKQENAYFAIGERTNANGSRKFREAMLAGDWETCVEMAKDQVKEGSHAIDVCVDYTGADGVKDMNEVISRFATQSSLPIVLDSTEPAVIETGLQWIGGKPILNSVNLEDGDAPGTRLDLFLRLAKQYGAAVICTCIDQEGQARTAEWKLRSAKSIYDIAINRYHLEPQDLIFDPLALPLTTGMEESRKDGIETINGIRAIKSELPGVFTVLGLSNTSFGLNPPARHVLNSVFLDECMRAGLDAAIAHPARIIPLSKIPEDQKKVCLDLIYDRRTPEYDPLNELIRMFEGVESSLEEAVDLSTLEIGERLTQRIIDGNRIGLEADLIQALDDGYGALDVINTFLLDGMKVVGDLFGSGQMQLPFVLSSAETMKTAVVFLEPYMEKKDIGSKGKVVLATVKGDVHDIGKNLVDIILTNNGYKVYNLGIKVSAGEMIQKATEVDADAIGMSGLLVKSTLVMRENLGELNERGLEYIPVILGGAALTRTYVEKDLRQVYRGRLFYGKDAFEGLHTMDRLIELKTQNIEDPDFGRVLSERKLPKSKSARDKEIEPNPNTPSRSPEATMDNKIFVPPFIGSRVVKGIPLDDISEFINETALFRNQWGFRPNKGETDPEFKERIRPTLREQLDKAKAEQVLNPQVVYGYYPVGSSNNDLVVFSDIERKNELVRFDFPRQKQEPYLCISDFFRPVDSTQVDYAAFHIVTMGRRASEITSEYFQENHYQDYLLLHGLSVEMTEALAEYWHHRVRTEWGFVDEDGPTLTGLFRQKYRGGRYSWGYPACPNLEDNAAVAELLEAGRIGVEVSEGFQLHPEQTTSAIICHHPKAKYFIA